MTTAAELVLFGLVMFGLVLVIRKLEQLEERLADIERLVTDATSEDQRTRERDLIAGTTASEVVVRLSGRISQ